MLEAAIASTDRAEERIVTIDGLTQGPRRREIQRRFNADPKDEPLRILLATDAAREGLNFQAHCTDLFHFDLPWNPGRIEQRNGRIDRQAAARARGPLPLLRPAPTRRGPCTAGPRREDRDDQDRTRQPLQSDPRFGGAPPDEDGHPPSRRRESGARDRARRHRRRAPAHRQRRTGSRAATPGRTEGADHPLPGPPATVPPSGSSSR